MRFGFGKSVAFALAAALSASVGAANIVITNSDGLTIAIKDGSSVQFDVDGNLNLECATVSPSDNRCCVVTDESECAPLGSTEPPADTTPPTAPTALAATAGSSSSISLTWTASTDIGGSGVSQYRVERCSGASCSNFSQIGTTTNTSFSSTGLTASTSYSYRVRAADVAGNLSSYSTTASATTQSGGTSPLSCYSSDPLVTPDHLGFVTSLIPWSTTWSAPNAAGAQTYPDSGALSNLPFPRAPKGQIVANEFIALANTTIRLNWTTPVQPQSNIGYPTAKVANSMFISISPCAGDVRPATTSTDEDQWLRGGCRKHSSGTIITYTTLSSQAESTGSVCKLVAGEKYYINIMQANPVDGLQMGENTCNVSSIDGCDVQGSHKPI